MQMKGTIDMPVSYMNDIQKLETEIDTTRILNEISTFIFSMEKFSDQICIQGVDENMDPFYGSRRINQLNKDLYSEQDFNVNLFPELDYTNMIISELSMCRTRVMRMAPKTCLSYHVDPTKRIHIPIETNEKCFLLIDKTAHYLPDDDCAYMVNTKKYHTAINASFDTRTHLVGVI